MTIIRRKNKPLWVKLGGGVFYFGNRMIKSGQKFRAAKHEIPISMRDLVMEVTDEEEEPEVVPKQETEKETEKKEKSTKELEKELMEFEKEQFNDEVNVGKYYVDSASNSKYNVLDWNGKVMNEALLTKRQADALVKDLEKKA